MIKTISLGKVEFIIFRLTRELMTYDEPIPDFATRFPNVLESCLAVPFQRFEKKSLYKTISQKAAILPESPAELKKETLEAAEHFIRTYLVPLK